MVYIFVVRGLHLCNPRSTYLQCMRYEFNCTDQKVYLLPALRLDIAYMVLIDCFVVKISLCIRAIHMLRCCDEIILIQN